MASYANADSVGWCSTCTCFYKDVAKACWSKNQYTCTKCWKELILGQAAQDSFNQFKEEKEEKRKRKVSEQASAAKARKQESEKVRVKESTWSDLTKSDSATLRLIARRLEKLASEKELEVQEAAKLRLKREREAEAKAKAEAKRRREFDEAVAASNAAALEDRRRGELTASQRAMEREMSEKLRVRPEKEHRQRKMLEHVAERKRQLAA